MIAPCIRSTLIAGTALLACAGAGQAEEAMRAGSYKAKFTKQEAQPLGGPDKLLVAEIAVGINKGKAGDPYLDGAKVFMSEIIQLDKGNGPQSGTISFVDDKGTNTSHYAGTITTTMEGGQPHTTGKGTWRIESGTGAYSGASGTGTYAFTMTAKDEGSGEWTGSVNLPSQ